MRRPALLSIFVILFPASLFCQTASLNPQWANGFWHAKWIAKDRQSDTQFGVYHFRKTFNLDSKPATFVVNVSADNRYRLFVNGHSVATGPARSDLANWNFETIDISPFLVAGKNTIASTVWNFGEYRPYSQISFQTAFILQGNTSAEEIINTNESWKVIRDSAYTALPIDRNKMQTYVVTAEGENVDAQKYSWGFEKNDFDDSKWSGAAQLWYPSKSRTYGTDGNWQLVPRTIPLAEEKIERLQSVRRSSGSIPSGNFLNGNSPFVIPANSTITILLDQAHETNAYPVLLVSGGKDAEITLTYAEALVDSARNKGNRNEIENKKIFGIQDRYVADGGTNRNYSPLFFRTFRYLQLEIHTKNDALTLNDIYGIFTGYPFEQKAIFNSGQKNLDSIWSVGWRTARLCAVDTYFDCPYYEQLQYVGDTRIQAMISLYVGGDDRLMKKAIEDLSHSFIPDGLTQSRYPSRDLQVIPTFSLWWVCMIHDYWMNRKDDAFVKSHLDGIEKVLNWYQQRLAANGMLGPLQWWQFADWSWPWVDSIRVGGVPPGASKGGSTLITLQFAYTLQRASQLMKAFGKNDLAINYANLAISLTGKTLNLCWDDKKKMLADTYAKDEFSQHSNIMGILTDAIPEGKQKELMEKILSDTSITQCTYYFKFYLFEALKKVKMGDRYLGLLEPWQDMIKRGLTTFAENPEPVRSDCHAWSASPLYEFLTTVCGINSASPGFSKVRIEPYLDNLNKISGSVPHPKGSVDVNLEKSGNGLKAEVSLPAGVSGEFIWKGKSTPLKPGRQNLNL
ncbi:MAG: alpha-L-rhamnosidase [Bacteroidetes bacterium]|nr:MAG: alpha-L-rhamnosidase [Bacteroidota bacterium]